MNADGTLRGREGRGGGEMGVGWGGVGWGGEVTCTDPIMTMAELVGTV